MNVIETPRFAMFADLNCDQHTFLILFWIDTRPVNGPTKLDEMNSYVSDKMKHSRRLKHDPMSHPMDDYLPA